MKLRTVPRLPGIAALASIGALAIFAPFFAPYDPQRQFLALLNAPPTSVHLWDTHRGLRAPFIHPLVRVSQLEQRYEKGADTVSLVWFRGGHLVQSAADAAAPLLLLGTDSVGRDVYSRLLFGARTSLGLAVLSAALAIVIGGFVGALAGYRGGPLDALTMQGANFVLALPAMYAALILRSLLPVVLSVSDVFVLLTMIFAGMGGPLVARGVRGIVRTERDRDYVSAARAAGASLPRILAYHLVPATRPFLIVQMTLLVPAFVVAEATFSYVGLGFPDPAPTWGTMLQEATSVRALTDLPWLLSPAVAMFLVVLALHTVGHRFEGTAGVENTLNL